MKKEYPLSYNQEEKGPLKVPFVLEELQKLADDDAIVVSGVGQHQMWISPVSYTHLTLPTRKLV